MSALESVFSVAQQKCRVDTEASYSSHLRPEKEYQEKLGVLKWPLLELRRKSICLVQM